MIDPVSSFVCLIFFNEHVSYLLAIRRCAGTVGAPSVSGGVRAGTTARARCHQRAVVQPLRTAHGRQPRPHHRRRHRRTQAPLRHLGQHCQCCVQNGKYRQSWLHTGIRSCVWTITLYKSNRYYFNALTLFCEKSIFVQCWVCRRWRKRLARSCNVSAITSSNAA